MHPLFKRAVERTTITEWIIRVASSRHLSVFGYHRILPPLDAEYPFDTGVISGTPEGFEREVEFIAREFDVISMQELCDALTAGLHALPRRPALITFDDCYIDNFEHAYPILRRHNVPACFFAITSMIGTDSIPWWDEVACCLNHSDQPLLPSPFSESDPPYDCSHRAVRTSIRRFLRRLKSVPWTRATDVLHDLRTRTGVEARTYLGKPLFMSWENAREMAAQGMSFGGHTRTHPLLGMVQGRARLEDEIYGCYSDLCTHLGRKPQVFAYPVGHDGAISSAAHELVLRSGFELAFSYTNSVCNLRSISRGSLVPRVCIRGSDGQAAFRRQLARAALRRERAVARPEWMPA